MAKLATLQQHYRRILTQWPIDRLRPAVSFQSAIQHRLATRLTDPSAPTTSSPRTPASSSPSMSQEPTSAPLGVDNIKSNEAQVTIPTPVHNPAVNGDDKAAEWEQVNVLYSLLENRYRDKYPLPETMMRPASQPDYYEALVRELEEAPSRSWWGATVKRWKGFLRFS